MAEFKIDKLQLVYGKDFSASEHVRMKHPKVGEIMREGEERYLSTVTKLTAIPSDMKYPLHKAGMDFMVVTDFELFTMLASDIGPDESELFFYGLDLSSMMLVERPDRQKIMVSSDGRIIIDILVHSKLVAYLLAVFHIKKKPERAANALTKRVMIDEEMRQRQRAKEKEYTSSLLPLISAMANSPGFKYNYDEILEMPFSQFMDAVSRTQKIKSVDHLAQGYYSGSFDTKKFDTKKLDWTGDL